MIDKLEQIITEKSEKIMANEKVECLVNNVGGLVCFVCAIVFGIMFIVGGASLMKTGKNYVVKPVAEKHEEAAEPEPAAEPAAE